MTAQPLPEEINQMVASRLTYLRVQANISRRALSESIGISRDIITGIEAKKRPITLEELSRLCAVFNVDPAEIVQIDWRVPA